MVKILLVDDDRLMTKMYKGKFEDGGFDIRTASNGKQGFEKTLIYKPDLILLDIMMPNVDGLTMLDKLKVTPETKNIPVVLLTNVGGDDDYVKQGLRSGAVAYLVKSEKDPKDVITEVKEILVKNVKDLPPQELLRLRIDQGDKVKKEKDVLKVENEYEDAKTKAREAKERLKELGKEK